MVAMETKAERRMRKLREVIATRGQGVVARVAADCGLAEATLKQLLKGTKLPARKDGTRADRAPGDALCRQIEASYNLGRGWFDSDDDLATLPPDAMSIARQFNAVDGQPRVVLFALLQNTISMASAFQQAQQVKAGPGNVAPATPEPSQAPSPERETKPRAGK